MLPQAKSQNLLYVGNSKNGSAAVTVFTYPQGAWIGTLRGFGYPLGLCVDAAQEVFVSDEQKGEIVEFPHGGSKPIRTLSDNQGPNGCSVDPVTGNLAVANSLGSVWVYPKAQGKPKVHNDPQFISAYYCSYDNSGTLFVDGAGYSNFNYYAAFALLFRNGRFENISLDMDLPSPGQVRWDGGYFAVANQSNATVYHVWIIHGYGVVRRITQLSNVGVGGFWIQDKTLIDPRGNLYYVRYPGGGPPIKTIHHGVTNAVSAAVSLVPTVR